MSTRKQDQETRKVEGEFHRVDGIVELNHPAPFWWQMIFYLSIVWAIGYGTYYLFGDGLTSKEELAQNLARLESEKVVKAISPEEEAKELRAIFKDPTRLASGKAVFAKNCVSCHGADGGGGIGPNLTDGSWIHGDGSIDAILKVVREGVTEKGMPPWGSILKSEEVYQAAAYVRSLRGTRPAQPKASQGTAVDPTNEI